MVHGLSEPFGIAIDNARMFRRIRTLAADEERSRIARELHDHVGSSLAMIGFEVDRALAVAVDGGEIEPVLRELREQVSAAVTEVRDTLYDLRTEVTDHRDLAATTAEFLQRVEQRSGIHTATDLRLGERLPQMMERELWQIVREAIVNAERHSRATHLLVAGRRNGSALQITVRDDGIGLDATGATRQLRSRRHARTGASHRGRAHRQVALHGRYGSAPRPSPRRLSTLMALSVVLVDDHTMLRQALRRALEAEGIDVIGEAADGEEGVRIALALRPDVVLMDVSMPKVDGIDATRQLLAARSEMRVVMLTMHIDREVFDNALKAGAVGYVTKDSSVSEVAEAVRLAANGDRPMSPHLAEALLKEARRETDGIISTREEEVLQLVADGLGTNEIAERLYISHRTVKNHLASIYDKLNARDRTQAVLMAVKMGIVKLT